MAFTEIYVDPSIAADSGAGTVGDPYGDLEYAIEQETFDTTNGTRINVKAGTDEVLAADLSTALDDVVTSVAWVPTTAAPLVIQGYTATAGDGGMGGISGGALASIMNDTAKNSIHFKDMHLHTASSWLLSINDNWSLINCELGPSTNAIDADLNLVVIGCYFHDFTAGALTAISGFFYGNYFADCATNGISSAITMSGEGSVQRCIVDMGASAGDGINLRTGASAVNNSLYADAGNTGSAILIQNNYFPLMVANNLIEGWSGTGGIGIEFSGVGAAKFLSGNAFYNCDTEISGDDYTISKDDNETLAASPFTAAATGDFSPVDTGNVKEGHLPSIVGGGLA